MRVTTKGQVTIPQAIREKLGISPAVEVDFIEEKGRIYLVKGERENSKPHKFRRVRGIATVKMTTDEIMAFYRGGKMKAVLVDSNIILDVFLNDPAWADRVGNRIGEN